MPMAAADFAGSESFLLWTLADPPMMSWIALPDTSPHRFAISAASAPRPVHLDRLLPRG
jgi:hypothetical protein